MSLSTPVHPVVDDRLMHTDECAYLTGLAPTTLRTMRSKGTPGQPPYVRIGGRAIRYRLSDVQAWIAEQTEVAA